MKKKQLNEYFFTFGHNQPHFPGYVIVRAKSESRARKRMIEEYGTRWCMCYRDLECIHRYDRRLVNTLEQAETVE